MDVVTTPYKKPVSLETGWIGAEVIPIPLEEHGSGTSAPKDEADGLFEGQVFNLSADLLHLFQKTSRCYCH